MCVYIYIYIYMYVYMDRTSPLAYGSIMSHMGSEPLANWDAHASSLSVNLARQSASMPGRRVYVMRVLAMQQT